MGQERDILSRESFLKLLRSDLNHLYDADHLRESPLLGLFGLSSRFDAPFALQSALIAAIEGLRPAKNEPAAEQYRRMYEVLRIRYVQQSGQDEVATQFGISIRQMRREQQAALELLGAKLWNQYQVDQAKTPETVGQLAARQQHAAETWSGSENDLAWLIANGSETPADFSLLLPQVMDLLEPFARQSGVEVRLADDMALPLLSVRWVVLRQALINMITLAIQVTSQKLVEVDSALQGAMLTIRVRCRAGEMVESRIEEQQASLDMIRRMMEISGGELLLESAGQAFEARLVLPVLEPVNVLVIDDNPDFFQLMQRYTDNTRFKLTGLQDPAAALSTARQAQPEIIVLDVMMPRVDGWQVLRELKQDAQTVKIAVVVCTVFAQKDLAFTLGADDYAQKPITQESLLEALDRQAARLGKNGPQASARLQSDR